ncbi:MAG TPA: hypothetical protein VFR38_01260 [Gaiellaceae bacterium]|nr:hypothetical protein [Gaiellaceae bacterium]
MDAGTHLKTELTRALDDRAGACDRACGTLEAAEEPVSSIVQLSSSIPAELAPNVSVVTFEDVAPGAVAELGCVFSRANEICEEHRRQHRVGYRGCRIAAQEREQRIGYVLGVHPAARAAKLDDGGAPDAIGDEARLVPICTMQHQGRDAYRAQYTRDVSVHCHARELRGSGRARREPPFPYEQIEEALLLG